jgi:glycosyltransferase involved in cell wall biosynthesis
VPGGVGRYVRALLRHLPASGIDVFAFAAGRAPASLDGRVRWTDIGHPRGSLRYEAWHRLRVLGPRLGADVVHAPSLAVPPRRTSPLVVTVHDIAFLRFPEVTTPRGKRFHTRGLELARRDADLVIAPSQFTHDELLREGFDAARVRVSPLGIDPVTALPDEHIDRILDALGLHEPFALTVGTVEPRKNLRRLVDAFSAVRRAHPDLTLAIVGPPGWGDVGDIDGAGVVRLGQLPWIAVDALYRRAHVCCLVSHYEGFGLPALEALARGATLVSSAGSALGEVVGDAALLVDPEDVDAIAAAITRAIEDDTLRVEMRERACRRAGRFTWERTAARHAEVYAEAVDRRRHARS